MAHVREPSARPVQLGEPLETSAAAVGLLGGVVPAVYAVIDIPRVATEMYAGRCRCCWALCVRLGILNEMVTLAREGGAVRLGASAGWSAAGVEFDPDGAQPARAKTKQAAPRTKAEARGVG